MKKFYSGSILLGLSIAALLYLGCDQETNTDNKLLGLGRQYLIVRQFGLGADIDAFNVSNNIPDLLPQFFAVYI